MANDIIINVLAKANDKEVNQLYSNIKKVEDEAEKGAKVKLNVDEAVKGLNSLRSYLQKMNQALGNDESKMANFAQMTEDVNRMSTAVGDLAEKFKLIKFDEKNGSFESIARIKESLEGINASLTEIKGSMGVFGNAEQLKEATEKLAEAKRNLDEANQGGTYKANLDEARESVEKMVSSYSNLANTKIGKDLAGLIDGTKKFDEVDSSVQKLIKDMMMLKEAGRESQLSGIEIHVPATSQLKSLGKNASELFNLLESSGKLFKDGEFNVSTKVSEGINDEAGKIREAAQKYVTAVEEYDTAKQRLDAAEQRANSVAKVAFDSKSIDALSEAMSGIKLALGDGKGDVTFGIDKQALQDITKKIGEVTGAIGEMKKAFDQGLTIKGVSATGEELDQMEQQMQEQIQRLMKYQSDVSVEIQKINASFKGLDNMNTLVINIETLADSLDTLYNSMKNIEGVGNTAGREAGRFVENLKGSGLGDIVGTAIKAEDLQAITDAIGNVQKAIDGIFQVGEGKELSVFQTQLTGVFNTSAIETWKNDFIQAIGEMVAAAKQLNPNQAIMSGSGKTPTKTSTKPTPSPVPQQKQVVSPTPIAAPTTTTTAPKKQYIDVLSVKKTGGGETPKVLPENIANLVKQINSTISNIPKIDENNLEETSQSFIKIKEELLKIQEATGIDVSKIIPFMDNINEAINSFSDNISYAKENGIDVKSDNFADSNFYDVEKGEIFEDLDAQTYEGTVSIITDAINEAKLRAVSFIERINESMSVSEDVPVVTEVTSNLPFMQSKESIARYRDVSNVSNILNAIRDARESEAAEVDSGISRENLESKLDESGIIINESLKHIIDEYYEKIEEINEKIRETSTKGFNASLESFFHVGEEDEANFDSYSEESRESAESIKAKEQEKIEEIRYKLEEKLKGIYNNTIDQFIASVGVENGGLTSLQNTNIGDEIIFEAQSKIAKSINIDQFLSNLISSRVNQLSTVLSGKTLVPELERGQDIGFLQNMGNNLTSIDDALSNFEQIGKLEGVGDVSQVSEKVRIAQEKIRLLIEAVDSFATNQGVEGYDFTKASGGKSYEEMANAARESLSVARASLTSFAQAAQKETQEVSQIAEKAKETSTTTSSTPAQTTKTTTAPTTAPTTTPATQAPTVPEQKPIINPKDIENAEQLSSILSSISTMFAGKEKISADMFGGENGFKPVLQTLQEIASAIRMVARSFQQLRGESKVFAPLEQYLGNITVQAELAADEVRNLNEAIEEEQVPSQESTPIVAQQVEQQEQAQERVAEVENEVVAGKEQEKSANNEIIDQYNSMIPILNSIAELKRKIYAQGNEYSAGITESDLRGLESKMNSQGLSLGEKKDSIMAVFDNIGRFTALRRSEAYAKAKATNRPVNDSALDIVMSKDENGHHTTYRDALLGDILKLGKQTGIEPTLDEIKQDIAKHLLSYIKSTSKDIESSLANINDLASIENIDPVIKDILMAESEVLTKRAEKMRKKMEASTDKSSDDSSNQEVSTAVEEVVSHAGQVIRERISQIDKNLEYWSTHSGNLTSNEGKDVAVKEGKRLEKSLIERKARLDERGIGNRIYNRNTGDFSLSNLTADEIADYYDYLKWVQQAIKSNQSKAPVNGKPLDRFMQSNINSSVMEKKYGITKGDFSKGGNFEEFEKRLRLTEKYINTFTTEYDNIKAKFKDGIIPDEVFTKIERFAQASMEAEESQMRLGSSDDSGALLEKLVAETQASEALKESVENHPLNIEVNTQSIDNAINKENEMQSELDETAAKAQATESVISSAFGSASVRNTLANPSQYPKEVIPAATDTQLPLGSIASLYTAQGQGQVNIPANFTVANLQNIASQFSETTVPINFTPKNLEELINILSQITVPITLTIENIEGLNPENADATSKFAESITKLRDSLVNIDTSKLSELSTLLGNMTKTTKSGVQLATNVQKIANALTNLKSTIGNMSLSSSTFLGDLKDLVGQGENLKALAKIISSSSQDILKAKKALGTEGKGKSGGKGSTEILQNDRSDVVEKAISSRIADLQKETNDAVITSVKKSFDNVLGGTKQAILNYRYLDKEGRNVSGSEMIMAKKEPVNSKEPNGDKQWVPEVRQLPENTRYEDIERVNGLLKDELSINKDIWNMRSEIAKLDKNSVKDQEKRDNLQARLNKRIDDRKDKQKEISKENSALIDIAKKDVDYAKKRADIEKSGKERIDDVVATRRGKERESQEKEALRQAQKQERADNKAVLRQAQRDAKEFNDREKERERIIEQARKDNEKDFNTQSRDSYNREYELYNRQQKSQTELEGLRGKDNLSGKESDRVKFLETEIEATKNLIKEERKLREERGLANSENQKDLDKRIQRLNEDQEIARKSQASQNDAEKERLATQEAQKLVQDLNKQNEELLRKIANEKVEIAKLDSVANKKEISNLNASIFESGSKLGTNIRRLQSKELSPYFNKEEDYLKVKSGIEHETKTRININDGASTDAENYSRVNNLLKDELMLTKEIWGIKTEIAKIDESDVTTAQERATLAKHLEDSMTKLEAKTDAIGYEDKNLVKKVRSDKRYDARKEIIDEEGQRAIEKAQARLSRDRARRGKSDADKEANRLIREEEAQAKEQAKRIEEMERSRMESMYRGLFDEVASREKNTYTNIKDSFKGLLGFDRNSFKIGGSGLNGSFAQGLGGQAFSGLESNLRNIGVKLEDYGGDVYKAINANKELQKSFNSLSVKTVDSMISEVNSQITTLGDKGAKNGLTDEGSNMLNQLNTLRDNLLQIKQEISTNGIVDKAGFDKFAEGVVQADASLVQFREDLKNVDQYVKANGVSLSKFQNKLAKWAQGNSRALQISEYSQQFKQIEQAANSAGGVTEARLKELVSDFNTLDKEVRNAGVSGLSFFDQWSQRLQSLKSYFMTFFSAFAIINRIKQAITTVKELDSAFVEMRKVSNDSLESLEKFANISFNLGDTVGTTGLQMQKSAADFMRIGEDINQATESALNANKLLNVSEFENIDDATESLIAMKAAYDDLTEGEIIDKLNEVGNNYAISTNQLAEGLQKAAATLKTQGNDINEAIALITAGNTTIQDAASVAAGVKVVSLRIAGTKEAEEELKAAGEDVEDYVVMTASKKRQIIKDYTAVASNGGQGVDIYDENGNYKSTYEILKEISAIYHEIQEEDKKYGTNRASGLIEELAGKMRSNIVAAILDNGQVLNDAYLSSLEDSENSAQEELEKYLDSIEGKQKQIQNKGQQISSDVFNVESIKTALDLANNFLTVVTQITDLLGSWSILIPVAAFEAFKEHKKPGSSLFTSISNGLAKGNNFFKSSAETDNSTSIYDASKVASAASIDAETAALEANTAAKATNATAGEASVALTEEEIKARATESVQLIVAAGAEQGYTAAKVTELATTEGVITSEGELCTARLEEIAAGEGETAALASIVLAKQAEINANKALAASNKQVASSAGLIGKALNWIKANPFTVMLVALVGVIAAARKIYKEFYDLDNLIEKSSKAFSDYETAQSDLDDLNTKLQETQDRITELDGMDSLTITEQEELDRLRLENEELERQKAILQEIADAKQTDSETATLAALSAMTGNYVNAQWDKDTLPNVTRSAIEEIRNKNREKAKQLEIYNNPKSSKEDKFKADNEIKAIDATIDSYEKQLDKDIPKLEELRQRLSKASTEEGKEMYKNLTDIMDEYIYRNKSDLERASDNFDKFISGEGKGLEKLKEKFAKGAKEGKSLTEVLDGVGLKIWNMPTESLNVLSEYFEGLKSGAIALDDEIQTLSLDIDELMADEDSAYSRIEKAFGEDASEKGDAYANMLERIKTAKELVESGDVGTEKFKSIAAFFSPTGAEDLDDWKENLPKIKKYFTEDQKGVYKFLDDLTEVLKDQGAKIEDGFYNFPDYFDAEEVGKKLGIGGEAVVTLMGEAMDKGLSQDFFNDSTEGFNTLIGLENELAEAELELNKLESDKSTSKTRLDAQREKVEDLRIRINQCTDSLDTMFKKFEKGDKKDKKDAVSDKDRRVIGQYAKRYNDLNNREWKTETERKNWESQRGQLGKQIIQTAAEKGITLDYNKRGQLVQNTKKSNQLLEDYATAIEKSAKGSKDAADYIKSEAKKRNMSPEKFKETYDRKNWLTDEQITELRQTEIENNSDAVKSNTDVIGENTNAMNTLTDAVNALAHAMGYGDETDTESPNAKEAKETVDKNMEDFFTPGVEGLVGKNEFGGRKTFTTSKKSNGKDKGKKKASAFEEWLYGNGATTVDAGEVPEGYVYRKKNKSLNLANRPVVPSDIVREMGWDTEKGSFSTVLSNQMTGENGIEYLFTPILPNGDVFEAEEFDNYMRSVIGGGEDKYNLLISSFEGENARKAADDYSHALHEVHDAYYLGDEAAQKSLHTLQDYTSEQLKSIDLTDDSTSEMEDSLISLMDELNISEDQVEQFINVLEDMGLLKIEPQVDLSQIDDVGKLNDTIAGQLSVGQSMTYTADVEGVQTEVEAVEEQEGVITYKAEDLDGVQKEVEPIANQDGTITYKFVPDKGSKKDADGKKNEDGGTITQKTDVDTSGFEKGQKEVQQGVQALSKETATPDVNLQGASSANTQLRTLENTMNRLNGKKSKVTLTTVKEFITKSSKQESTGRGQQHFNGTFHTSNAYAGGTDVSLSKDETALINELGEEIVVRNGKAMTFNNGYPTFAKLKRGDIIFNHKQTEELEENGYVTGSHAKIYGGESAFADGTIISNAFARIPVSTKKTTTSKKSSNPKSSSTGKSTGNGKSTKKKGSNSNNSSSNKKWDKFESWLDSLFDWVEVRLERLSEKTERWTNLFEKFLNASSSNAQRAYDAAISVAKAEQRYTTTASNRYLSEALDVGLKGAQAAGTKKVKGKKVRRISDQWVRNIYQRLLNDNLTETEIKKMSEKQRSLIDAMQDYIGKAKDAAKSTVELTDAVNDLIKAQRDAKVEFKRSAFSSMVESDNRYRASSKNSALTQSSAVARYAITSFDESINGGNSYLGTLASQAKSAGTFAYTKKKVKGKKKTVAANANTKIYQSLKGADKTNYKKYITSATSYMNKGEVIPQKIVDFFERFNPSLAAKYEAWNAQVANLEVLRQEAADNYAENIKTIIGNISESYANIDEEIDNAISLIESQAENMEATAANERLNDIRGYRANIIANDQAEIDTYDKMIKSYSGKMSGSYKGTKFSKASTTVQTNVNKAVVSARNAAKNGVKISDSIMMDLYNYYTQGYLSASFFESCLAYNLSCDSYAQAVNQKQIDEETRKQELLSLYDKKASNISSFRDANVSRIEARKNSLTGSYDDIITQSEIIAEREKEIEELRENLDDAVKNGDIVENTQPWLERVVEIQEKVNDLNELKLTMFETEIEEKFERAINKADELIDKFDTIKGLIDDEMLYDKDSGKLTDTGWLALGLDSKKLAEQQENLKRLYDEYDEVVEAYENGERVFGDQTYDEKINDISDSILSLYSDMKSVNDDMLSIIEGQADAELSALQKVVDKRKEALSRKKEYYDYDKTIKGKTKDLQSLEQQIRALEGVAGQEAAAKRASLMAQRKEMQEDLDETVKDHIYNMQIEGLDDMMNDLNEDLDDWKKEIHTDSEARKEVLEDIRNGLIGNSDKVSNSSIAGILNLTSNTATATESKVDELLNRSSKTLSQDGDKVDNGEGDTSVLDATGVVPTPVEGKADDNPVAREGLKEISTTTKKQSTTTKKPSTTTKKLTVTKAKAQKALEYILGNLKYASSQNKNWAPLNKKLYNSDKNRRVYMPASVEKKAWKIMYGTEKGYTNAKLLDALKSTGIWSYLINNVRTSKNGSITITSNSTNAVKGFAKGGTVHKSGHYLTDEKGEEIIVTKQGILRPLSAGTSVIPADITERLYAIASNYDMGANARVRGIDTSKFTRIGGDTISPIINCPITIEGNANEQDVINAINKAMPKISKHVQNDIRKDLRKSGR